MQTELQQDPHRYCSVGVAARLGDLVGLQEMVWHGRPIDVFDNRGWSPIHEAAHAGNTGCLEFLLRQPGVDPDWVTHAKETALILAARQGQSDAVVALINARADVDFTTNEGYTPLWEALNSKSYQCFKTLIKKDADVNARIYTGYTALHLAAERGSTYCVNMLLQHGADIDVFADHNLSPLFLAAHKGHTECVRNLIEVAKDRGSMHIVNAAATDNATPLLIAAQEGHDAIVAILLHHGADANIADNGDNAIPLQYAVSSGHTRCVELLLQHTDMTVFLTRDFDGMHPLVQALRHTDTTILKLLAARLPVTRICTLPSYLLQELGHLASVLVPARKCSLLCLLEADWPPNGAEFLLKNNVLPNSSDEDELPPLLVALWTNNVPLFQLLLRYRASPNIYHKNVTGNVAMLMAFQKDLERDLTTMIVRNSRQPNFQIFFIWQLFLAGAESHSLFDINDPLNGENANSPAITNLFGLMFHMFHRKENLVPVLALLMYISDHACLPRHILSHFEEGDRKKLQTISDKTNLLSHRCRRVIVHTLGKENRYCRTAIQHLKMPIILQDYLMFSELGTPLQDMILKFITVNPEDGGDSDL
ncbi:ankyrin repeat and SOCS box protein 2 [Aplysia californica]|uniref:Ankyrin repeat and SOCS box protein 2 n=1 Tax=Aplysia californica TaxID=6500 RepID=A0ABM0K7D4_APLCA|nr:ankyrin repeat and SOCS box protein 2 [Aplysia californica]